jgi:hypothetical protein
MAAAEHRTWRQVATAAIVVVALAGITLVGGAAFFIYRSIRTEVVPADAADARMASARARFGTQPALLRIDADGEAVVTGRTDAASASHRPLQTLRALAYDPGPRTLRDVSIPFWLLRLAPDDRISIDAGTGFTFRADRLNLNVAALEALGPGLVLDHADRNGMKVLVWTE